MNFYLCDTFSPLSNRTLFFLLIALEIHCQKKKKKENAILVESTCVIISVISRGSRLLTARRNMSQLSARAFVRQTSVTYLSKWCPRGERGDGGVDTRGPGRLTQGTVNYVRMSSRSLSSPFLKPNIIEKKLYSE